MNVIQKFVKSNGPKAFICRTCWRKNGNSYSWIITNKHDFFSEENIQENLKFCTNARKVMNSCTMVNTCRGKHVEQTTPFLISIARYLNIQIGVNFEELIGDFIKDESGLWWLINIRSYFFFFFLIIICILIYF